ncbi:MAG: hypothetical protein UV98_C0038G0003 [Parcubacteria group bacterium GW2011_GWB1_43_6]|nr:MAG: hypothetical protein UV98_C0038G0003 [Parcubacteria group bacterium GW2011_GWB1_43_6]
MNSETKVCQNCKQNFVVEPDDFKFYEKIDVPAPTWCWRCRAQRRLAFRSGWKMYRRKVEGRDDEAFTSIPPDARFRVFDEQYWWSDAWDPMSYGRDYDFSRPFFEQFEELMREVPIPHRRATNAIRSEYSSNAIDIKDCYLCFNAGWVENSMYSETINRSRDSLDLLKVEDCEQCYELFDCKKCFRTFFSSECNECVDVRFSKNCRGCSNCFGCVNLRHKNYYIFNKPYTREEYFEKLKAFDLGSSAVLSDLKKKVVAHLQTFPVKYMHGLHNVNVAGDYLDHCKNVRESYACVDLENCSYCQLILFLKSSDCMDMTVAGGELCYELQEAGGYNVKFSYICVPKNLRTLNVALMHLEYTMYAFNASHLFGCMGVRNKQYCILNKQYTKEEYEKLRNKIIAHMNEMPYTDNAGRVYRYGEFFPPEFSPFPYNDTWAQDYFPLTKETTKVQGFWWRDLEKRNYQITLKPQDLPDNIKNTKDDILNQVIGCEHEGRCDEQCTEAFCIVPQELNFYRKMNLPLPRLCPVCRHYQRTRQRNPWQLWHRQCVCEIKNHEWHVSGKCSNEFEASYTPERPEIVYCGECYNREVV